MDGKPVIHLIRMIVVAIVGLFVLQQVLMGGFWLVASLMDSGWSGEHQEAGPVPLSAPNTPIVRLVNKRTTFERSFRNLRWDDGKGAADVRNRIQPLIDAVPNELLKQLAQTVRVRSKLPGDTRLEDYNIYESWGIVVSLNPDVMIISAHALPNSNDDHPMPEWNTQMGQARWKYIAARDDAIDSFMTNFHMYAGTLVPWTPEMYVVSTDARITNGPLQFNNHRAEIAWAGGKLVLKQHDEDADVSRE